MARALLILLADDLAEAPLRSYDYLQLSVDRLLVQDLA
jgi:hypothetical protein